MEGSATNSLGQSTYSNSLNKYQSNRFQMSEQLSAHASQISDVLNLLFPLFQSFESKLEKLLEEIPQSASTTSLYNLTTSVKDTTDSLVPVLKKIVCFFHYTFDRRD